MAKHHPVALFQLLQHIQLNAVKTHPPRRDQVLQKLHSPAAHLKISTWSLPCYGNYVPSVIFDIKIKSKPSLMSDFDRDWINKDEGDGKKPRVCWRKVASEQVRVQSLLPRLQIWRCRVFFHFLTVNIQFLSFMSKFSLNLLKLWSGEGFLLHCHTNMEVG